MYDKLVREENGVLFAKGPEGWWWARLSQVATAIGLTPEEALGRLLPVSGRYTNVRTLDGTFLELSADDSGIDVEDAPDGYSGPTGTGRKPEQVRQFLDALGGDVLMPRGWVNSVLELVKKGVSHIAVERWQIGASGEMEAEGALWSEWERFDLTHYWVGVPVYAEAPASPAEVQ